jgi:hypothetical protein
VDQYGRVGGILLMVLGVLLITTSIIVGTTDIVWAIAFGLSGIPCLLMGGMGFRMAQQERVVEHLPLAAFRSLVQTQPVGFSMCVRCRVVMPGNLLGSCYECGSTKDCVAVLTEQERKIALATIPADG